MTHKPLPPPSRTSSPDALTDAPQKKAKKAWSKPTISTMDGVVTVESGANQALVNLENTKYHPPS